MLLALSEGWSSRDDLLVFVASSVELTRRSAFPHSFNVDIHGDTLEGKWEKISTVSTKRAGPL